MAAITPFNRRRFLQVSAMGAGSVLLGLNSAGKVFAADPVAPKPEQALFGVWLQISDDGQITYVCPESETGQGSSTGLAQIIADEMDADFSKFKFVISSASMAYASPEFHEVTTGGSAAIRTRYMPMRQIGATARALMIEAAAKKWGVSAQECKTQNHSVIHGPSGQQAPYGALVKIASQLPVPQNVPLKPSSQWKVIGQSVKRIDLLDKCAGRAKYAIDLKIDGMVHAHVVHSPVFGGQVSHYDKSSISQYKIIDVVSLGYALAVVADDPWTARVAAEALTISWTEGPASTLTMDQIRSSVVGGLKPGSGFPARKDGNAEAALARKDVKIVEAEYIAPYLDHACMEPMIATAWLRNGELDVWSSSQVASDIVLFAQYKYNMAPEKVRVHRTLGGGSFGRRGKIDAEVEAILLSAKIGKPVKVIRSREEDIQHGFYRCFQATRMKGAIDTSGKLLAVSQVAASQSINANYHDEFALAGVDLKKVWDDMKASGHYDFYFMPFDIFTVDTTMFNAPYQVSDVTVEAVKVDLPVPVGWWRGVGSTANNFFTESFIDEAAHAAKMDPVAFRRPLLSERPRQMAVLEKAVKAAEWGKKRAPNMGRGFAMCEGFDAFVALVVDVEVIGKKLRIKRIVSALDTGIVINPDQVIAQMEGGILYGLSAALFGEITIDQGRVQQSNFHDYRVMTLAETPPEIETHIVQSDAAPGSISELGTPVIMPALTNAIFAATGTRIRELPIAKHNFEI